MMRICLVLMVLAAAWNQCRAEDPSEDQAVLSAFSEPATMAGGPLWVTLLTNASIDALWRDDPAHGTLQIEAAMAGTAFYVMGTATRPLRIAPEVSLSQDGATFDGVVVNVSNLNGETAPEGSAVLGLLEFGQKVDIARPFTLDLGGTSVQFQIDPQSAERWGEITMPAGAGF